MEYDRSSNRTLLGESVVRSDDEYVLLYQDHVRWTQVSTVLDQGRGMGCSYKIYMEHKKPKGALAPEWLLCIVITNSSGICLQLTISKIAISKILAEFTVNQHSAGILRLIHISDRYRVSHR